MTEWLPGEDSIPDEEIEYARQRAIEEIENWIRDGLLNKEEEKALRRAVPWLAEAREKGVG